MVGDSLLFPETEWYKFLEESVFSMRRVESIKQTTQNFFFFKQKTAYEIHR